MFSHGRAAGAVWRRWPGQSAGDAWAIQARSPAALNNGDECRLMYQCAECEQNCRRMDDTGSQSSTLLGLVGRLERTKRSLTQTPASGRSRMGLLK